MLGVGGNGGVLLMTILLALVKTGVRGHISGWEGLAGLEVKGPRGFIKWT